jgi:ferredoxin-NADP reductase
VELTVARVRDGEVSPYLTEDVAAGDQFEVRGPLGGWFVWRLEQTEPIQLVAGGSGIVPLMCMLRLRRASGSTAPARLLYSVRTPDAAFYTDELAQLAGADDQADVTFAYTRASPTGYPRPPGRVDAALLAEVGWPAERQPTCYVCGPTPFVEAVATLLVDAGHKPNRIRTERFGPSGQ